MPASSPKVSSADIIALMAASIGIRTRETATEDSTAVGTAHIIIPESVRDVFLIRTDDGKSCRSPDRLRQ